MEWVGFTSNGPSDAGRGARGEDCPGAENGTGARPSERPCVLLVEDDPAQAAALRELLAPRYDVLWAADGATGLRMAREERPDVALLDRVLPVLDGEQVLDALQADPTTVDIPVLFLSGERDEAMAVSALEHGAVDYVRKPAAPRELVARLDRALQQARQRRALQALALTDALTGLFNVRALMARLDEELKRARRYRHPLAVLMMDLDHLKDINDRFGHDAGNRAILTVARHLRANLREVDFAARIGGDEFVVLLPHQTAPEAAVFAERVRAGLRDVRVPVGDTAGLELSLSLSIGVAEQPVGTPVPPPEALLKSADRALYRAKAAGRDRLVLYSEDGPDGSDSHH